ncbi:MAG TPA: DNA mismatch repair protein MutS [Candidatus Poseidoniales archaeon]|nr:MAG TPA: DNA mismatch repair protein MutS [Candidatus Poseidoniales archaeon]|tara:strand:- start:4138 stop:6756 length:2619 start_codon:yes stop_codon:yes gene_type:complete
MMDQFMEIKHEHPGTILFFRMGDFYELFHEDAEIAAPVLGLALTSRDKNAENPIPMAGFPWHALEDNLKTMLKSGFKVTVAEQEQELREGAKLLERVVTRIYTPGSLYEESLLSTNDRSVLSSIVLAKSSLSMAVIDSSTGESWASTWNDNERFSSLEDELLRWNPAEIIISPKDAENDDLCAIFANLGDCVISQHSVNKKRRIERLESILEVSDLGHLDLDNSPLSIEAAGFAADYLAEVHFKDNIPIRDLQIVEETGHLVVDQTTLRNLEITSTLSGEYEGSLISSMNFCRTAMGRRLMKTWLLRPLYQLDAIELRHNAVKILKSSSKRLDMLRQSLAGLRDLERLSTQLAYNRSNARDLLATALALERMPAIMQLCSETNDLLLSHLSEDLTCLSDMAEDIIRTLKDELPLSLRDGGIIRDGVNSELDDLRVISSKGYEWFKELESKLRKELEIPSLKVRTNRQIGWFIEVTNSHLEKVPESWIRKQQMTNGSRFTTEEIVERDDLLMTADSKIKQLEYTLFQNLRDKCRIESIRLANIAGKVAAIDVLQCFATVARKRNWNKPKMVDDSTISIKQSRHPVLEQNHGFVANDITMDKKNRFLLITGPNMGGKSTYLRTAALLSILAQSGSYVPAESAKLGLVDRIFTRVGASDDLKRGRSTFMMEMIEVAHILRKATNNSLVLLDEIGRGTSTFDGLSIAWSVTEDICNRIQCRTLFATHYHQLVGLEGDIEILKNIHVQVSHVDGKLKFLHTIADGPCDESYGIQVAALAGLPRSVVERATDLLQFLEKQAYGAKAGDSSSPTARDLGQTSLMSYFAAASLAKSQGEQKLTSLEDTELFKFLSHLDLDEMSPKDAMDALYEAKSLLGD